MNARFEIIKELADNLILFGKTISPKVFYLPTPLFHYELAEILMDRLNTQVCIQAPRGFGKSTLAVLMILHHIIYDPGDKVIIIQSKTQDEAKNRLAKIKNIISYSQNFIRIYGYAGEEVAETWTDKKIKTRLGNIGFSIRAIGTGMPARGTLESGLEILEDGSFDIGDDTRITLYLVDDPDDEDNTLTKESMRQNYSKFAGNKEGLDSRTGRVLVIGTPVRQGCIVDLLYNSEGWVTKKYQAIDEGGNLLWEELRNKSWLDSKKEEYKQQGFLSKFYSEFQCEIVGDEDQLFKEEYIQYWDGYLESGEYGNFIHITNLNGELKEPIIKPVNVYIGIDPASSTKQSADYSVTLHVAYDADENIYVLPYFRDRVTPTDHAEQIINTVKATHPNRGHVETVGYQEMLRQYLKKRLREENITLPGLEIKFTPRSEKNARLEDLHPFFYNRKVFVQPNMRALIDELLSYPRGKHDDCIKEDALIKTIDGYKEVKDVKRGDLVLTHKGRYKRVEKVIKKPFSGKFCTLNPVGQLPLEISTDHKIYYASRIYCKNGEEQYYPHYENRGWVEAENFKKTYRNIFIVETLNENSGFIFSTAQKTKGEKLNELVLDKEFAKILGYFLAEGCAYRGKGHSRRFAVSFASHKREYGKRRFVKKYFENFGISVREKIKGNIALLDFDSKFFHKIFSECYDEHKEKIIPPYARHLGKDLKYTLIWWMAGDGWAIKKKSILGSNILKSADRYCGSTSKKLVLEMRDIAFSLGYYATIRKLSRFRYEQQTKDFYQIDIRFKTPHFSKITTLSDWERGSSLKIENVVDYDGDVYDLQVEDDHSFVCNGFVVHNCLDGLYYATRKLLKPTHTHQENEYNEDLKLLISRGVNNQRVYSWKVA